MQMMRSVHSSDQWAHIRSSAGTGDEDEIALQALSSKTIRIEQIGWPFDYRLGGKHGNVRSGEQADHSRITLVDGDADRPRARNSGKGVGDAEVAGSEILF